MSPTWKFTSWSARLMPHSLSVFTVSTSDLKCLREDTGPDQGNKKRKWSVESHPKGGQLMWIYLSGHKQTGLWPSKKEGCDFFCLFNSLGIPFVMAVLTQLLIFFSICSVSFKLGHSYWNWYKYAKFNRGYYPAEFQKSHINNCHENVKCKVSAEAGTPSMLSPQYMQQFCIL